MGRVPKRLRLVSMTYEQDLTDAGGRGAPVPGRGPLPQTNPLPIDPSAILRSDFGL